MYIPPHFRNENQDELVAFMRSHPFALLASNGNEVPDLTHIPFVVNEMNGRILLRSHLSAGNPHARNLQEGADLLVAFSGPNAYISPGLYEKKENVPTWNYIAVHARGKCRLLQSDAEKTAILEEMIGYFEPAYRAQWESLDPKYIGGMLRGIVAFSVEVINLDGKFKLSQNKTRNEQKKIADSLSEPELKSRMNQNIS